MARDSGAPLHPRKFRRSILAAALVGVGTWWGLGLPYSLFAWLLDAQQWFWVMLCYAWEVPVAGALGPVLFPQLWWRDIERRWERAFGGVGGVDSGDVAALERSLLDYPARVAWVLLITSLIGYGVGAVQLRLFAQLPVVELFKIGVLGLVTGLIGGLFAFLYLEWLLGPLLRRLGTVRATVSPAGRRIPLYAKVFACSIILTLTALLLLGPLFYSRGERILEEQVGNRMLAEVRHLAGALSEPGRARERDPQWWQEQKARMHLGASGYAYLIDARGAVLAGSRSARDLADEGFRRPVVRAILSGRAGDVVDRVYVPRIVAFAPLADPQRTLVAVAYRHDFEGELATMLRRGFVVFAVSLLVALIQGFLFSRRLSRPIEVVTRMASNIASAPGGSWATVPVRTNDEVGELATAFNQMTARLKEARRELERHSADLERRVAEATRSIATLYDVARTTTSTLEIDDVLKLVAEKTMAALGLERLVLLRRQPDMGEVADVYATTSPGSGERIEVDQPIDLAALGGGSWKPVVVPLAAVTAAVPPAVARWFTTPDLLYLPLAYKGDLLGVVLAGIERAGPTLDLDLAVALATQAAVALANAALFETVRRHEAELQTLSQMRVQLQEESLRTLSRELHDGVGQVLTAIKMDLGMIEHGPELDVAALRTRVRETREQVTDLLQEVRTMSQLLRPSMLDDFGLVPTLQWFTEKFAARAHVTVDLRTPPAETRLPGAIEVLLYRVTQEALTNVAKHAHARHVEVELRVEDGEVSLTIADDGVGFDVERFRRTPAHGGVGLLGIRERVAYYHGRVDIRSRPHEGVQITLVVPIAGATGGSEPTHGRMPLTG